MTGFHKQSHFKMHLRNIVQILSVLFPFSPSGFHSLNLIGLALVSRLYFSTAFSHVRGSGSCQRRLWAKFFLCHSVNVSEYCSTWTDSKQGCFDPSCSHGDSWMNIFMFGLVLSFTFSSMFRSPVLEMFFSRGPPHLSGNN